MGLDKQKSKLYNFGRMAREVKFWKKLRRWVNRRIESRGREVFQKNSISAQVGKLLQTRGNELITMTTL